MIVSFLFIVVIKCGLLVRNSDLKDVRFPITAVFQLMLHCYLYDDVNCLFNVLCARLDRHIVGTPMQVTSTNVCCLTRVILITSFC